MWITYIICPIKRTRPIPFYAYRGLCCRVFTGVYFKQLATHRCRFTSRWCCRIISSEDTVQRLTEYQWVHPGTHSYLKYCSRYPGYTCTNNNYRYAVIFMPQKQSQQNNAGTVMSISCTTNIRYVNLYITPVHHDNYSVSCWSSLYQIYRIS